MRESESESLGFRSSSSRAGPLLEHSHFHGSLPLFMILSSSSCRVQTDAECTHIFLIFFMVHIHDCLGGPGERLQWLGNPKITACSALEWSVHASDLATCPKSRKRLLHRTVESCVWLVRLSAWVLVTRWRCEMRRSLLKHHWWQVLSFFSSTEVTDHVSAPQNCRELCLVGSP